MHLPSSAATRDASWGWTATCANPAPWSALFAPSSRASTALDVLVNNAGVGVGQPMSELPHDEWNRIIGTNLTGVYHCCRAVIPHLVSRGGGWIVNVSSLASTNPFAGGAAYCASKAGLNAFSEALMQELRYSNIRVSYVLPGSVATGFSGRDARHGAGLEAEPGRCGAGDRRSAGSPARSLPSRVEIRPARPQK